MNETALIVVMLENKQEGEASYRAFRNPTVARQYAVSFLMGIPYVHRITSKVHDGTEHLYAMSKEGFEEGCAKLQLVFLDETPSEQSDWLSDPTVGGDIYVQ